MKGFKSNIIFLLAGVLVVSLMFSSVPVSDAHSNMLIELASAATLAQ